MLSSAFSERGWCISAVRPVAACLDLSTGTKFYFPEVITPTQMARITPRSAEDFLNCLVTSAVISPSGTVFQPVPGGSLNLLSLIVMIGGTKLTESWAHSGKI